MKKNTKGLKTTGIIFKILLFLLGICILAIFIWLGVSIGDWAGIKL